MGSFSQREIGEKKEEKEIGRERKDREIYRENSLVMISLNFGVMRLREGRKRRKGKKRHKKRWKYI